VEDVEFQREVMNIPNCQTSTGPFT
jgi:hypothetical protein